MRRTVIFATTAAVLVCVWLGLSHFTTDGPGTAAFAEALEQIEEGQDHHVEDVPSTHHATSRDGKTTWVKAEYMDLMHTSHRAMCGKVEKESMIV